MKTTPEYPTLAISSELDEVLNSKTPAHFDILRKQTETPLIRGGEKAFLQAARENQPTDLPIPSDEGIVHFENVTVSSSPDKNRPEKVKNTEEKKEEKFLLPSQILLSLDEMIKSGRLLKFLRFSVADATSSDDVEYFLFIACEKGDITVEEKREMLAFLKSETTVSSISEKVKNPPNAEGDLKIEEVVGETLPEQIEDTLREARSEYATQLIAWKNEIRQKKGKFAKVLADLGGERSLPDQEKPQELKDAEEAYLVAKKKKRQVMFSQSETMVGMEGDYQFNMEMIKEAENEYISLQRKITESLPPLEKGIVTKAFEKWAKLPMPARVALSTALLTGTSVAIGSLALGGAAAYGGYRLARGLAGASVSQGVGKLVDGIFRKGNERMKSNILEQYGTNISEENFENPEENIYQEENEDWEEERREENREKGKEDEKRKEEDKKRCEENCERPCVEKCIREECGEGFNCDVDEVQKKCEGNCKSEDGCVEKCMKGEKFWDESKNENKEEKGVFQVGGNCRTSQGKTEGFIWFNGWGEPFEQIQNLKNKYYSGGQAEWCKYDFENLKKQRQEFESSFNQEFVSWFFEKHLANSAENWEQAVSGIFEIYWKDVDNSRETAYRMQCLGISELPTMNLINVKYDTDYGSIEFWEEIKNVKLEGMDKEVQLVSPYMKIWVFPSKEFIIYEMKKSMKNHEFPGPSEEKTERENQEGLTDEERRQIKQDEKFMEQIKEISEKYGGNLDLSIQFKDYETNEIVFNLYVQVNENEIINMKPMLPEEVPSEDVKAEVDFKIIYELIYDMEKEMRGEMIESPPWDKKLRPMQKIKEITSGIKMYFKIKKIINSAKITPSESEEEIKNLFEKFMSMTMEGKDSGNSEAKPKEDKNNLEEEVWESKESITGEVLLNR